MPDVRFVESPLVGSVTLLHAQPGAELLEGEAILAIESMKMLTDVCAPCACTLVSIVVALGEMVTDGQPVAEILTK